MGTNTYDESLYNHAVELCRKINRKLFEASLLITEPLEDSDEFKSTVYYTYNMLLKNKQKSE